MEEEEESVGGGGFAWIYIGVVIVVHSFCMDLHGVANGLHCFFYMLLHCFAIGLHGFRMGLQGCVHGFWH